MSDSIEWAHATAPVYILDGDETASDGNTPNSEIEDSNIAVVFEQCALYGTPVELLAVLASAMSAVAERITNEDHYASERAKRGPVA